MSERGRRTRPHALRWQAITTTRLARWPEPATSRCGATPSCRGPHHLVDVAVRRAVVAPGPTGCGLRLGQPLHAVCGQPFDGGGEVFDDQPRHGAVAEEALIFVGLGI